MKIVQFGDVHISEFRIKEFNELLLEGKKPNRIVVVGNPISEFIAELNTKGLLRKRKTKPYYLATIHRKENLQNDYRLLSILGELNELYYPVKLSAHPTLMSKIPDTKIYSNIEFFTPSNFVTFINYFTSHKYIRDA